MIGLHLRELVHRVDAVQAEVVLAHVRDDRDVVVPDADAAQQHAAARRLEHRDVGLLCERRRRSAEPRVVAGLDQLAVVADTRRRSRSTRPSGRRSAPDARAAGPWSSSRSCRSPGRRGRAGSGTVGSSPGSTAARRRPASAISRSGERRSSAVIPAATSVRERLGGRAPAPRERDHDLVALRSRARAHGEPPRAARPRRSGE